MYILKYFYVGKFLKADKTKTYRTLSLGGSCGYESSEQCRIVSAFVTTFKACLNSERGILYLHFSLNVPSIIHFSK